MRIWIRVHTHENSIKRKAGATIKKKKVSQQVFPYVLSLSRSIIIVSGINESICLSICRWINYRAVIAERPRTWTIYLTFPDTLPCSLVLCLQNITSLIMTRRSATIYFKYSPFSFKYSFRLHYPAELKRKKGKKEKRAKSHSPIRSQLM